MYLVGFLEVAGHLSQNLAVSDADIDCETEGIPDLVLDLMGNGYWIWKNGNCPKLPIKRIQKNRDLQGYHSRSHQSFGSSMGK